MNLEFERGDQDNPIGHALLYFKAYEDDSEIYATRSCLSIRHTWVGPLVLGSFSPGPHSDRHPVRLVAGQARMALPVGRIFSNTPWR